jgi:hypothetical protein
MQLLLPHSTFLNPSSLCSHPTRGNWLTRLGDDSNIYTCNAPPNALASIGPATVEQSTAKRVRPHPPLPTFTVITFSRRPVEPPKIYWMYASRPLLKPMLIDTNHRSLMQPDVLAPCAVTLHYHLSYPPHLRSQH